MKKILTIISTLLILTLSASFLGCGFSKEDDIERIKTNTGTYDTVYRYDIKEVQLVTNEDDEVLLKDTDNFKYYYSDTKLDGTPYIEFEDNKVLSEQTESTYSILSFFFDDVILSLSEVRSGLYGKPDYCYGAYYETTEDFVKVRVVLDDYNAYRPFYSTDNNLITIGGTTFYAYRFGTELIGNSFNVVSNEISYKDFKKKRNKIAKEAFENNLSETETKSLFEKEFKELAQKGLAVIMEEKITSFQNALTSFIVEYEK